jgi:hypothetical protein
MMLRERRSDLSVFHWLGMVTLYSVCVCASCHAHSLIIVVGGNIAVTMQYSDKVENFSEE